MQFPTEAAQAWQVIIWPQGKKMVSTILLWHIWHVCTSRMRRLAWCAWRRRASFEVESRSAAGASLATDTKAGDLEVKCSRWDALYSAGGDWMMWGTCTFSVQGCLHCSIFPVGWLSCKTVSFLLCRELARWPSSKDELWGHSSVH